jgi:hypothetical protein
MAPGEGTVAGRFPLGQLVITRNAAGRLTPEEIADGIARHARGDWGRHQPGGRRGERGGPAGGLPPALVLRARRLPFLDHHRGRSFDYDRPDARRPLEELP